MVTAGATFAPFLTTSGPKFAEMSGDAGRMAVRCAGSGALLRGSVAFWKLRQTLGAKPHEAASIRKPSGARCGEAASVALGKLLRTPEKTLGLGE